MPIIWFALRTTSPGGERSVLSAKPAPGQCKASWENSRTNSWRVAPPTNNGAQLARGRINGRKKRWPSSDVDLTSNRSQTNSARGNAQSQSRWARAGRPQDDAGPALGKADPDDNDPGLRFRAGRCAALLLPS